MSVNGPAVAHLLLKVDQPFPEVSTRPSLSSEPMTQELLSYWLEHPDAQGTARVIVEWWLLEEQIHRSVTKIEPVLAELIRRGFVVERQQGDGAVFYRLNRKKRHRAKAWLKSGQAGS